MSDVREGPVMRVIAERLADVVRTQERDVNAGDEGDEAMPLEPRLEHQGARLRDSPLRHADADVTIEQLRRRRVDQELGPGARARLLPEGPYAR